MQFIDLKSQYQRIQSDVQRRMNTVLEHGSYILGPEVKELEQRLASYVGVKHCLSCASGTDALLMALMAYGVGPGDAVFTTPFTFMATAEAIALVHATPVFVDIDPVTFNIDPTKLEEAVIAMKKGHLSAPGAPAALRPRGIIAVDLFGIPAEYDAINTLAKRHGLFVIEDAAQSFGAEYHARKACSLMPDDGIAATSFFPAKPLGCYGDGGAVFTNDDRLTEIMYSLRVHGQGGDKYENVRIGINGRLDTLQAAVLLSKLDIFDDEVERRQIVAQRYTAALEGTMIPPLVPSHCKSAWAQYSVLSDDRSGAMERLKSAGIPTAIYYPKPLHLQKAFGYLGYQAGVFPACEAAADRIFSLPMHPYLSEDEQERIMGVMRGEEG